MRYSEIKPQKLYVYRKLLNANKLIDWISDTGMFLECLSEEDFHLTVIYGINKVNTDKYSPDKNKITIPYNKSRKIVRLGTALVIRFNSKELTDMHNDYKELGIKTSFPNYIPHIAITYDPEKYSNDYINEMTKELSGNKMFQDDFKFGPEIFDKSDNDIEFKEQEI